MHLALLTAAGLAIGCGASAPETGPSDMDRRAMLEHVATQIIVPTYGSFAAAADELEVAVEAHCESLANSGDSSTLQPARAAWMQAMNTWQRAELMVVGPASMDGDGLRDRIYSWDIVSTCAVDQAVELYSQDPSVEMVSQAVNRKGLDAIEYLLFAGDLEHTCPSQIAMDDWNALSDSERQLARCRYAAKAASDVAAAASVLVDAWAPGGGNYLAEIIDAGSGRSSFGSTREALDVVSEGLFYLDDDVKGMKIAEPAGIAENTCSTVQEPCLEELESPHAGHSLANIESNLEAFAALYYGEGGVEGPGYRQLLLTMGADDLAGRMDTEIDDIRVALSGIQPPLSTALMDHYDAVVDAHLATGALTDDLKSQFLTVLGIALPNGESDND